MNGLHHSQPRLCFLIHYVLTVDNAQQRSLFLSHLSMLQRTTKFACFGFFSSRLFFVFFSSYFFFFVCSRACFRRSTPNSFAYASFETRKTLIGQTAWPARNCPSSQRCFQKEEPCTVSKKKKKTRKALNVDPGMAWNPSNGSVPCPLCIIS